MTATTTLELTHVTMPELDAKALARLRVALASERAALEAVVAERAATVAELIGHGDVDSLLEREVADASVARARDAIEDVGAALARMDAATYGLCESCGLGTPSNGSRSSPTPASASPGRPGPGTRAWDSPRR